MPRTTVNPEDALKAADAYRKTERKLAEALSAVNVSILFDYDLMSQIIEAAKKANQLYKQSMAEAESSETFILNQCGSGI